MKYLFINTYGVLGSEKILQNGKKIFSSHIQDGMGVTLALRAGLKVVVLDDFFPASLRRAKELKTDFQLNINDSNLIKVYKDFIIKHKIDEKEIAWIANDFQFLSLFKNAGLKIAVPQAHKEIKKTADYITKKLGGKGGLREAVEFIIKKDKKWQSVLNNIYPQ